ncbi:unnamed protein product [Brassicogethes aeneus]|uniref:G-protein coupled receptors family 1 profile domain-containing protein n=1 Tax=Brassicogethes aeneus TaxID=1431903 RepID=A0A9P0FGE3_BRAAE|nr:unnamed protein product [Brassicogethes aeneus]
MPVFIFNSYYEGPALGDIGCRAYGLLGGLTGIASICTLAAIAMDRFYVIKYPLNRSFTNMRVKVCIVVVWIYALIFSVCPALNIGLNSYVPEGYLTSCSFDYLTDDNTARIFILVFFVAAFCVPLGLIIFSYINILSVVMNRSVSVSGDSSRHSKEEDKRKQEMKLAMLCLSVVFLWFVSWTPYAIVALLGVSGNKQYINPITSMIPALFAKMASAVDPYVYALSHPKFKEEFYALFKKSNNNSNRVFSVSKPPKNINEEKSDDASEVESVELAG